MSERSSFWTISDACDPSGNVMQSAYCSYHVGDLLHWPFRRCDYVPTGAFTGCFIFSLQILWRYWSFRWLWLVFSNAVLHWLYQSSFEKTNHLFHVNEPAWIEYLKSLKVLPSQIVNHLGFSNKFCHYKFMPFWHSVIRTTHTSNAIQSLKL